MFYHVARPPTQDPVRCCKNTAHEVSQMTDKVPFLKVGIREILLMLSAAYLLEKDDCLYIESLGFS